MAETGNERAYELFTRHKRGDDLIHRGTVRAPSDRLAKIYAKFTYDEEGWVEMYVVRREHLLPIREVDPLFGERGSEQEEAGV